MSIRRFILMASVDPFRPETRQLLARMTTQPSVARATLIDQTIRGLIDAGLWDTFDALYFPAAHDAQAARLNWVADAYNLTEVGSPTFSADLGYSGSLSTGFSLSAAAKYALGDAAVSGWGQGSGDYGVLIAYSGSSVTNISLSGGGSSAGVMVVGVNQPNSQILGTAQTSGFLSATRFGGVGSSYLNGVFQAFLQSETVLAGGAATLVGGASGYATRFASIGSGRSGESEATLYDIVSAYLGGL